MFVVSNGYIIHRALTWFLSPLAGFLIPKPSVGHMEQGEELWIPNLQGAEERESPGGTWTGEELSKETLKSLGHFLESFCSPVILESSPFQTMSNM